MAHRLEALLGNDFSHWLHLVTRTFYFRLLLDRGFYHFYFWQQLIDQGIHFISRLKKGAAIQVKQVFTDSYGLRDRLIRLGSGTKKTPYITLRQIGSPFGENLAL